MIDAIHIRKTPFAASLLQALLIIAVCLPSGSIFGLNVKIPVFSLFAIVLIFYLAIHSDNWPSVGDLTFFALFVAGLSFWGLVAVLGPEPDSKQLFLHLKDLASTVVLAWLCIFCVRRHLLRPEQIAKALIYGVVSLALMKLALIAFTIGPKVDPIQIIANIFGEESLVGGEIGFGIARIEFPSDIVASFALFAVLCPSVSEVRFRKILVVGMVAVLLLSGLLAFARYIWFLDAVAIAGAMILERRTKLLVALMAPLIPLTYVYYEALQPLVESRFFSNQASESDLIRLEQSKALLGEIESRPLIGKGLGAHADAVIRNEENRYSYELQWMALTMQFGALGIAGIVTLIVVSSRDLWAARHPAKPWLILLFALWLLSGWTNPHLTSSFAGATFGMFMALFHRIRFGSSPRQAIGGAA